MKQELLSRAECTAMRGIAILAITTTATLLVRL